MSSLDIHAGDVRSLRERKRQRTRAGLIDAALQLFATEGYAATTIDDIAAAVMVSRGTIFNYFHGKEGIILAWAQDLHSTLATMIEAGRAAHLPSATLLRAVAEALSQAVSRYPAAIRGLITELSAPDHERALGARAAFNLAAAVTPIAAAGQEAGDFRTDFTAAELGAFVAGAMLSAAAQAADPDTPAVTMEATLTLLLAALAPPPA